MKISLSLSILITLVVGTLAGVITRQLLPPPAPEAPAPVVASPPTIQAFPPPRPRAVEPIVAPVVQDDEDAPSRCGPPPPVERLRCTPSPAGARAMRGNEQALFEDAVAALREKETRRGCALLARVLCDGSDVVWRNKAQSLFDRRCE